MRICCIGTGPSLTKADAEKAAEISDATIVINNAWQYLPGADYLYAADWRWWQAYGHEAQANFKGVMWTQRRPEPLPDELDVIKRFNLLALPGEFKPGFGKEKIHYGGHSGHQAINMAVLLGAQQIILLGYDFQAQKNKTNFFGCYPRGVARNPDRSKWKESLRQGQAMLHDWGIELINCSRETAIDFVPRLRLSDVA